MGKTLVLIGLIVVAVGLVWMAAERLGLGRLTGDIVIERENFRFYFPLMTSIVISVVLSLIFWFFSR